MTTLSAVQDQLYEFAGYLITEPCNCAAIGPAGPCVPCKARTVVSQLTARSAADSLERRAQIDAAFDRPFGERE